MATIALDATYVADPEPSGISVYSRRLIESLTEIETGYRFLACYRLSRWKRRKYFIDETRSRLSTFLFQEPWTFWLPRQADLFHSLAQRPAPFRFKKEIVTIHDVFPLSARNYSTPSFQRKFSKLLIEAARRAARIITPSEYTASELHRHTGTAKEKIRIIAEGVDLPTVLLSPQLRRKERERRVGKGQELILLVGVLQTRKNTLGALRALERLPAKYSMVSVGGEGYGSEAIQEYASKHNLGGRIKFIGHASREELSVLYQAATLLLFPSFEEGFGLPVLEAMAHGLPVVASRTSSLPEVGGEAAAYIDPHNEEEIAETVQKVAADQALRQRMMQAGMARAKEFSWRRAAAMTLAVYEEVLGPA
ncbi:MAG: glycosyltransferase family 4 protein [Terriglobia bacterium]